MQISDKTLGKRIEFLRKLHGFTAKDFSKMLGISVSTLRRYEKDITVPSCAMIVKLSFLLEVTPQVLLAEDISYAYDMFSEYFNNSQKADEAQKLALIEEFKKLYKQ